MASPLPYLQFYCKEWLASSTTRRMPLAARGAYIDLCCFQWEEECIPDCPEEIARMLGATLKEVRLLWPHIERVFIVGEDGNRRNARVARDRASAMQKVSVRSECGAKGGRPPKAKPEQMEIRRKPKGFELDKQTETKPKGIPEPEPEPEPEVNTHTLFTGATVNDRQVVVEILIEALPESHRTPEVIAAVRGYGAMRGENASRDPVGWPNWGITQAQTLAVTWGRKAIPELITALERATAGAYKHVRFDDAPASRTGIPRASPPPQESAEDRAKRRLAQVGITQ
jgi:uncharacterized protein YdaU (DUF1376 family)